MGKRELLLLVVFVVLGVGAYQVSAPAAPADAPGFSLSRLFQMAKAHLHGPQVHRTVTRTATLTVPEDIETLDLGDIRGSVFVEGTSGSVKSRTVSCTGTRYLTTPAIFISTSPVKDPAGAFLGM